MMVVSFTGDYTNPASAGSFSAGNIIGMAYDQSAGTLAFYKSNVLQGTITNISTTVTFFPYREPGSSSTSGAGTFNFGQRPFAYTAPSGFKALCTQNLPESEATIVDGGEYFNTVLWYWSTPTKFYYWWDFSLILFGLKIEAMRITIKLMIHSEELELVQSFIH
jgi:hypothetical protein